MTVLRRILTILFLTVLMLTVPSCGRGKDSADGLKICCTTEDGRPLSGVSFQVCTDRSCCVFSTDEEGELFLDPVWKGALVHTVPPAGYVCTGEKSFTLNADVIRVIFRKE